VDAVRRPVDWDGVFHAVTLVCVILWPPIALLAVLVATR
jgi:hypothetical protein